MPAVAHSYPSLWGIDLCRFKWLAEVVTLPPQGIRYRGSKDPTCRSYRWYKEPPRCNLHSKATTRPRLDFSLPPHSSHSPLTLSEEPSLNASLLPKPCLRLCPFASQSAVPAPAASALPGNVSEMQILGAQPPCPQSHPGDSDTACGLRLTALENAAENGCPPLAPTKPGDLRAVFAEFLKEPMAIGPGWATSAPVPHRHQFHWWY